MSMLMGIVFVFDRPISWLDIYSDLSELTQLEELASIGNSKVVNADWLADGLLSHYSSPMGFDILQLKWSPNILANESEEVESYLDQIETVMITGIESLELMFGYLTHYTDHFDEQWIENNILMNLLIEDQAAFDLDLVHWVAHRSSVSIGNFEVQSILHESKNGRLLCLGEDRNPFR